MTILRSRCHLVRLAAAAWLLVAHFLGFTVAAPTVGARGADHAGGGNEARSAPLLAQNGDGAGVSSEFGRDPHGALVAAGEPASLEEDEGKKKNQRVGCFIKAKCQYEIGGVPVFFKPTRSGFAAGIFGANKLDAKKYPMLSGYVTSASAEESWQRTAFEARDSGDFFEIDGKVLTGFAQSAMPTGVGPTFKALVYDWLFGDLPKPAVDDGSAPLNVTGSPDGFEIVGARPQLRNRLEMNKDLMKVVDLVTAPQRGFKFSISNPLTVAGPPTFKMVWDWDIKSNHHRQLLATLLVCGKDFCDGVDFTDVGSDWRLTLSVEGFAALKGTGSRPEGVSTDGDDNEFKFNRASFKLSSKTVAVSSAILSAKGLNLIVSRDTLAGTDGIEGGFMNTKLGFCQNRDYPDTIKPDPGDVLNLALGEMSVSDEALRFEWPSPGDVAAVGVAGRRFCTPRKFAEQGYLCFVLQTEGVLDGAPIIFDTNEGGKVAIRGASFDLRPKGLLTPKVDTGAEDGAPAQPPKVNLWTESSTVVWLDGDGDMEVPGPLAEGMSLAVTFDDAPNSKLTCSSVQLQGTVNLVPRLDIGDGMKGLYSWFRDLYSDTKAATFSLEDPMGELAVHSDTFRRNGPLKKCVRPPAKEGEPCIFSFAILAPKFVVRVLDNDSGNDGGDDDDEEDGGGGKGSIAASTALVMPAMRVAIGRGFNDEIILRAMAAELSRMSVINPLPPNAFEMSPQLLTKVCKDRGLHIEIELEASRTKLRVRRDKIPWGDYFGQVPPDNGQRASNGYGFRWLDQSGSENWFEFEVVGEEEGSRSLKLIKKAQFRHSCGVDTNGLPRDDDCAVRFPSLSRIRNLLEIAGLPLGDALPPEDTSLSFGPPPVWETMTSAANLSPRERTIAVFGANHGLPQTAVLGSQTAAYASLITLAGQVNHHDDEVVGSPGVGGAQSDGEDPVCDVTSLCTVKGIPARMRKYFKGCSCSVGVPRTLIADMEISEQGSAKVDLTVQADADSTDDNAVRTLVSAPMSAQEAGVYGIEFRGISMGLLGFGNNKGDDEGNSGNEVGDPPVVGIEVDMDLDFAPTSNLEMIRPKKGTTVAYPVDDTQLPLLSQMGWTLALRKVLFQGPPSARLLRADEGTSLSLFSPLGASMDFRVATSELSDEVDRWMLPAVLEAKATASVSGHMPFWAGRYPLYSSRGTSKPSASTSGPVGEILRFGGPAQGGDSDGPEGSAEYIKAMLASSGAVARSTSRWKNWRDIFAAGGVGETLMGDGSSEHVVLTDLLSPRGDNHDAGIRMSHCAVPDLNDQRLGDGEFAEGFLKQRWQDPTIVGVVKPKLMVQVHARGSAVGATPGEPVVAIGIDAGPVAVGSGRLSVKGIGVAPATSVAASKVTIDNGLAIALTWKGSADDCAVAGEQRGKEGPPQAVCMKAVGTAVLGPATIPEERFYLPKEAPSVIEDKASLEDMATKYAGSRQLKVASLSTLLRVETEGMHPATILGVAADASLIATDRSVIFMAVEHRVAKPNEDLEGADLAFDTLLKSRCRPPAETEVSYTYDSCKCLAKGGLSLDPACPLTSVYAQAVRVDVMDRGLDGEAIAVGDWKVDVMARQVRWDGIERVMSLLGIENADQVNDVKAAIADKPIYSMRFGDVTLSDLEFQANNIVVEVCWFPRVCFRKTVQELFREATWDYGAAKPAATETADMEEENIELTDDMRAAQEKLAAAFVGDTDPSLTNSIKQAGDYSTERINSLTDTAAASA